ncbi:MAG TPA: AMP-binding protein [Gemmatimonadaceae bacterium]
MSDPLALLPLALAAGAGTISVDDGSAHYEAQQLVAAGLTLLQRSAPLVRALSGRRSAILLPTSPAFFTALAASDGRGAVLVDPLAAPIEIERQCRDADVGAVFTTSAFAPRLPAGMVTVLLDEAPRRARVLAQGIAREVDLGSHHGLDLAGERGVSGRDEEAAIVYTSAIRGTPLGAVLTHANLLANARSTIQAVDNSPADRVLALLPFAYPFGLTVTGSAPLLAGAQVITMSRFDPVRAVALLERSVTEIVGVSTVFRALLSAIERRGQPMRGTALRACICGGAPLSVDLQDRWAEATGVELRQSYGVTEASPVCLFNDIARPNMRGTLGVAYPHVDVDIFPPMASGADASPADMTPLAIGTPGEICVRGENVFRGYLGGSTAGLTRRGEWLCTGDRGVRNADGTVAFLGVIKRMFTCNGFNVYPAEIEHAACELAGVIDAEARAAPDPETENDILLRVRGAVTVDVVRAWCAERLSAYKQPRVIELVEDRVGEVGRL